MRTSATTGRISAWKMFAIRAIGRMPEVFLNEPIHTSFCPEEVAAMTEGQPAKSEELLQTAFRLNKMSDLLRA